MTSVFRGDVWDVHFPPPVGPHPCVVLTTNALISRLSSVTVAVVTGTEGPSSTHVEVDPDVGLTGRDRSWVNVTDIYTVSKGTLRRRRGRLAPPELSHVADAVRLCLDLDP